MGGVLHNLPQALIGCVLLLALFGAEAVGRRWGKKHRDATGSDARQQAGAIEGAILGFLALLLAFTFSMAANRFDMRRELTLKDANAIGTALLRTDLVAEPEASALKAMLTRYVDLRVDFYEAQFDPAKLAAVGAKVEKLQAQMWQQVVAAARRDSGPTTALLASAMNDVIDMHGARVAALYNNVPDPVMWFLLVISVVAAAITGYAAGVSGAHYFPSAVIVMLLIASVTLVIIDLDRPRRGLIRAGQEIMLDLQKSLKSSAH